MGEETHLEISRPNGDRRKEDSRTNVKEMDREERERKEREREFCARGRKTEDKKQGERARERELRVTTQKSPT